MLWLWMGCLHQIPEYLLDPYSVPHSQCATDDSLRSVGFSEDSAAIAQENARRRLAQSISSTLHTVQVSQTAVVQIEGDESSSASFDAVSTVKTDFDYNHLIRDIEPVHRSRDGYRSLACLKVSDLESHIQRKHQSDLHSVKGLYQTLLKTESISEFSTARKQFLIAIEPMRNDADVLDSLTNGASRWGRDLAGMVQSVEQKSQKMRRENPFYMATSQIDPAIQSITLALSTLLQQQNIRVQSAEQCAEPSGYLAGFTEEISKSKGPMGGFVVSMVVWLDVSSCAAIDVDPVRLKLVSAQGYHSTNSDLAEKAAVEALRLTETPEIMNNLYPIQ